MQAYETIMGTTGELWIDGKMFTTEAWSAEFAQEVAFFQGDLLTPQAAIVKSRSCQVKAASKTFDGDVIAQAFNGITPTTGETLKYTEAFGTSGAGPHVVANGATHVRALEVRDGTGQRMKVVAAAPAVGEYTVVDATGSYGFNAAEPAGKTIDYEATAAGGKTARALNAAIGVARTVKFIGHNSNVQSTRPVGFVAYAVVPTKLGSLGYKHDDFMDSPSFEGTAIADVPGPTGKVWDLFYELV